MNVFTVDDDVQAGPCCVCGSSKPSADDALLRCGGKNCTVLVHQQCYGIHRLPERGHKWYCKKCEPFSTIRSSKVKCCLCPNKDGALKHTTRSDEFAHVLCALALPHAQFQSFEDKEPIVVGAKPSGGVCFLCLDAGARDMAGMGACIGCKEKGCDRYFHVTCAQKHALLDWKKKPGHRHLSAQTKITATCRAHRAEAEAAVMAARMEKAQKARAAKEAAALAAAAAAQVKRNKMTSSPGVGSSSRRGAAAESSSSAGAKRKVAVASEPVMLSSKKRSVPAPRDKDDKSLADVQSVVDGFVDKQKRLLLQYLLDKHGKNPGSGYLRLSKLQSRNGELQKQLDELIAQRESLVVWHKALEQEVPPDAATPSPALGAGLTSFEERAEGLQQSVLMMANTGGQQALELDARVEASVRKLQRAIDRCFDGDKS